MIPELFTTGLSLRPKELAEPDNGRTMVAMKRYAYVIKHIYKKESKRNLHLFFSNYFCAK
jgi:hypothetical protein